MNGTIVLVLLYGYFEKNMQHSPNTSNGSNAVAAFNKESKPLRSAFLSVKTKTAPYT